MTTLRDLSTLPEGSVWIALIQETRAEYTGYEKDGKPPAATKCIAVKVFTTTGERDSGVAILIDQRKAFALFEASRLIARQVIQIGDCLVG